MTQTSQALQALHAAHHARFGEARGARLPLDYGDFEGEVAALRSGVGLLSGEAAGVIAVRGPDAAEYLNGLTTNDVQHLREGHAQPNLLCGTKGKILNAVEVVRTSAEQYLVVTAPDALAGVAAHLEAYHVREDVALGRVPLVRLDLIGPETEAALAAVGAGTAAPIGSWREAPLLTVAHPLGPLPGALVLLPEPHAPAWAEALLAAHPGLRMVGFEAFDEVRILAGVPRFGVDYGPQHLPAEAALYDHLSFTKGCYVGQEVHARLHHRGHVNRKLCAVRIPAALAGSLGPALAPGTPLFAGGEEVGLLTSLARLAVDGTRAGIALVRYTHLATGEPVAPAAGAPAEVRLGALSTDIGVHRA